MPPTSGVVTVVRCTLPGQRWQVGSWAGAAFRVGGLLLALPGALRTVRRHEQLLTGQRVVVAVRVLGKIEGNHAGLGKD